MRALAIQSGLDLQYWPLLLTHALLLLNYLPNKVAITSSFEAIHGKSPDISDLRPFGCRALWLDPSENKLQPRASEAVYVGPGGGGHKLFNPVTKRIITRRDIRFLENEFPLTQAAATVFTALASPRRAALDALNGPQADDWRKAFEKEMANMERQQVWELVPRSVAKKVMQGRWVLKEKEDIYKARWVVRGFNEAITNGTYASVLGAITMRILLAFAAARRLKLRHVDITAAFLHSDMDEEIYVEQPHGMETSGDLVCKLKKALYGLRTAPRRWQQKLHAVLRAAGFLPLQFDSNVFRRGDVIVSTYVDDFMILAKANESIDDTIRLLAKDLEVKDLGDMTRFIGIEIEQSNEGIRVGHSAKITAICEDLGLQDCRGAAAPIADDGLVDRDNTKTLDAEEATRYRSAVGSILHVAIMTRPDIQYAVNRLARRVHAPTHNAMLALKHLVRYLSRTRHATLLFPRGMSSTLTGSSDSSWGSMHSPHGTSGTVFSIGGAPVAWWAKKQSTVAQSTCEAEYEALRHLAVAAKWIRPLFNEIFGGKSEAIRTQIDNTAALITATSEGITARNRHFIMRQATVREAVKEGLLKLVYTPSAEVIADGLTKALTHAKHAEFAKLVSIDLGIASSGRPRLQID
jgi:hypothetical protein